MSRLDPAHIVGTGGAIGALLRYGVAMRLDTTDHPLGTFTVNVVGSFVLGLLTFTSATETTALLLGTGVCGSFTTFSSFSYETVRYWDRGDRRLALGYSLGTLAAAGGAVGTAWLVAQAI